MKFGKTSVEKELETLEAYFANKKLELDDIEKKISNLKTMGEFTVEAMTTDCPLCANSLKLFNKEGVKDAEKFFDVRGICEHCGAEIRYSDPIGVHMMDKTKFYVMVATMRK